MLDADNAPPRLQYKPILEDLPNSSSITPDMNRRTLLAGSASSAPRLPKWNEVEHPVDSVQECPDRVLRIGQAAFGHRAVSKHNEMLRGRLGSVAADVVELFSHRFVEPRAVSQDRLTDRVLRVWVFGCTVQEGAPTKPRSLHLAGDVIRYGANAEIRRCRVLECGRDGIPDVLIRGSYVFDNQIIFARKVPVEGRASYLTAGNDLVDTDGVHALGVEESARRGQ